MKATFITLIFFFSCFFVPAQIIFPAGSVWKYLDDGSNQGTSWYSTAYNDSSWSSGAAQLGYGDGDETTVLSYGNNSSNKHITYYFRKTFSAQNTTGKTGFKVEIIRDDGAVVYLNGNELFRTNMPQGNITHTTLSAGTVAGSAEDNFYTYEFPSSLLNNGQNVIAVEIHQRSVSSSDISFDMKLGFSDFSPFRKDPYLLYPGDNTKMLVLWQMKQQKTCNIFWGTDTSYSTGQSQTQEYGNSHQHKIVIGGLTPETHYFYKVVCDSVNIKKGDFITGAATGSSKINFLAYGDTRTNINAHDSVAKKILDLISQDSSYGTFIVSSGDMVSNGNNEDDWDNQFFDPEYKSLRKMMATLPYLASMGNHEGQGVLFAKYFPYPMFVNGKKYYSFDYGPVHFTVIDQFENYNQGSNQYNWIVNDLSTTTKSWKIILLHKPGWTAGGGHSNSSKVQNLIQPLCVQYGVSFVIGGHNHYYARASVNGVQHITTGGGGAPLYNPNSNKDSIVKVDKSYHFCKFAIDNDTLRFSAVRADGSIIETFDYQINTTGISNYGNYKKPDIKVIVNGKTIIVKTIKPIGGNIEIFDSLGRRIIKQKITSQSNKLTVKATGVYFVKISSGKTATVKKVFVK